jgi:uncharacterized membrane protein
MRESKKTRWFSVVSRFTFVLFPIPVFATLPPVFRQGWVENWMKVLLTIHLLGVIFWVGGLGVRLFLLSSVNSGTNEAVRIQLYESQQRLFRRIEVPAFLLALLAGLLLVYGDVVTYQRTWFMVKMLLVASTIVVDIIALRQFDGVRAGGKEGRAVGFGLILVVMAALMLFAST